MLSNEVGITILIILSLFIFAKIFCKIIFPAIVEANTVYIEMNPDWVKHRIKEKYYGFYDMDIILVNDPFNQVPRFKKSKDKKRLQLLLPNDISVDDSDSIAQMALASKLKIYHNLWFPDKPAYWLSILCYMLDGGDIQEKAVSWEEANKINEEKDNKPIDDNDVL